MSKPLLLTALLMLPLLGGCAAAAVRDDGRQPLTLSLHPGQDAALADNTRLRYVRVLNDSRCPPAVQCIHAGDARVLFEYTAGSSAPQSLVLSRATPSQPLGARWLHLLDLTFGEAPVATVRIDASATAP